MTTLHVEDSNESDESVDLRAILEEKIAVIGILEAEIVQLQEMLTEALRDASQARQQCEDTANELSALRLRHTVLQDQLLQIYNDTAQGVSSRESLLIGELERAGEAIAKAKQTVYDLASLSIGHFDAARQTPPPIVLALDAAMESIEETLEQTSGKIQP